MYTDATQWSRIRERLLDKGESLRSVSLSEGIARPTLRRILASEHPSRYRRVSSGTSPARDSFMQQLKRLVSENRTAEPIARVSVRAMHAHLEGLGFDASYRVVLHHVHRIRRQDVNDASHVWSQVEQLDDQDAARLLKAVCHRRGRGVLDEDTLSRHLADLRATSPETTVSRAEAKWGQWVAQMERTPKQPREGRGPAAPGIAGITRSDEPSAAPAFPVCSGPPGRLQHPTDCDDDEHLQNLHPSLPRCVSGWRLYSAPEPKAHGEDG